MHQPVLVDAYVNEGTERRHVRDDPFEEHARRQIRHRLHALGEGRGPERRAGVTAWLLQFAEDVGDGRHAESLVGEALRRERAQHRGVADQPGHGRAGGGQNAPDHGIGLRVDAGRVERIVAAADAQEAGALLEGLGAQPGHLGQRAAAAERAGRVPVRHDAVGEPRADPGHPGQQRRGGGVDVDPDRVDAVLHHGVERAGQLALGNVVLVLAHADGLRVDLDQFGQGVLQAARDRDRAAQRHVHTGQFTGRVRGRRIDRRAGLGHHDLGELELRVGFDQVRRQPVRLPGGGSVADRDQLDAVRRGQPGQDRDGLVPAAPRLVRVDRFGRDRLPGPVGHRDLDPGAETRVQPHRRARAGRGGQQQVAEVGGEHAHRFVLGALPQPHPQVDAQMDQDPGPPRPADGLGEPPVGGAALVGDPEPARDGRLVHRGRGCSGGRPGGLPGGLPGGRLVTGVQGRVEDLLLLAPEHGQDAVRGQPGERLGEVEIVGELGAGLFLARAHPGDQPARRPHPLAQFADQVGVLGEALHQDGARPVQGGPGVGDAPVRVDVGPGGLLRIMARLGEQQFGQWLQPCFAGDLRLRAALRLVGQVDVFEPGLGVGRHDLLPERVVELALPADGLQDRGAALVQLAQVMEPFLERPELGVVEGAGHLLAVAGDERHRGPAVEQLHGRRDLALPDPELGRDPATDRRRRTPGDGISAWRGGENAGGEGHLDRLVDGHRHGEVPLSRWLTIRGGARGPAAREHGTGVPPGAARSCILPRRPSGRTSRLTGGATRSAGSGFPDWQFSKMLTLTP